MSQQDVDDAGTKSPLLDRYQNVIFAALVVTIIAGVVGLATSRPAPVKIVISPPAPTPTPGPIRVHVSGAVGQPGVYTLPPDAIVEDAIDVAGGALETAGLAQLNLARRLRDGERVHVPDETGGTAIPGMTGGRVNINMADAALLDTLPNIGPSRAQDIIDYREEHGPFASIEEIMDVPGIGEEMFAQMEDLITVD